MNSKKSAFTVLDLLVVIVVVIVVIGLCIPAAHAIRDAYRQQEEQAKVMEDPDRNPIRSITKYGHRSNLTPIMTIEHDGHLFVTTNNTIIHHPGCPCLDRDQK